MGLRDLFGFTGSKVPALAPPSSSTSFNKVIGHLGKSDVTRRQESAQARAEFLRSNTELTKEEVTKLGAESAHVANVQMMSTIADKHPDVMTDKAAAALVKESRRQSRLAWNLSQADEKKLNPTIRGLADSDPQTGHVNVVHSEDLGKFAADARRAGKDRADVVVHTGGRFDGVTKHKTLDLKSLGITPRDPAAASTHDGGLFGRFFAGRQPVMCQNGAPSVTETPNDNWADFKM